MSRCYWVYMLLCDNNTYYTGYTTDLRRRYQEHVTGSAKCKYTRSFKPIKMAQCWKVQGNKADALRVERYIKKLSRVEKEVLVLRPQMLAIFFSKKIACDVYDSTSIVSALA